MLTFIHVTALTFAASVTTVLTEQMHIKSPPEIGPSYTILDDDSDNNPTESGVCRVGTGSQCPSDE